MDGRAINFGCLPNQKKMASFVREWTHFCIAYEVHMAKINQHVLQEHY